MTSSPAVGDDWYTRRRTDAEGRFFRLVSDQTARKAAGATGTRQGIYVFAADGTVLAFGNAGNSADATRDQLRRGLAAFAALPAGKRTPGVVRVPPPGDPDPRYTRTVPPGGLAVKVHGRILDRAADPAAPFTVGTCDFAGGTAAARDFLWLTAADVAALAPADPTPGATYPLPAAVAARVCQFHLDDFTTGEPPFWTAAEVRRAGFTLTVTAATPAAVELRLDGTALMATGPDPAAADRGFDVAMTGRLTYDRAAQTFTRFDIAAVGDHWGAGPFTRGTRPGRTPLGVTFGPVVPADGPAADRVPPQAARDLDAYYGRR